MTTAIDAYVIGLAVSSTPCFGYHEAGNPTCGGCPVAAACSVSWRTRAATVAAQLVKTERANKRKAAAAAAKVAVQTPVPTATATPSGESIDDILASIGRENVAPKAPTTAPDLDLDTLFGDLIKTDTTPAPAPAPVQASVPEPVRTPVPVPVPEPTTRVTMMKAVIDSVCFTCGARIPAKSDAAFIPGKGLRHPGCP